MQLHPNRNVCRIKFGAYLLKSDAVFPFKIVERKICIILHAMTANLMNRKNIHQVIIKRTHGKIRKNDHYAQDNMNVF